MKIIDIIKLSEHPLRLLENSKVPIHYVNHLKLYHEYKRLIGEGHKKTNAIIWLSDIFHLSESVIFNIVSKFEKSVDD